MTTLAQYVFDFLKLTPRYFITLGGAAAFLLFSPERFTKYIGVFDFTQNNRPIIGLVFVLAAALLFVTITIETTNIIRRWWKRRKFYTNMEERLNILTEDEKQVLRFYIAEQTKSNVLRIDDGTVQGLVSAGIIYRSARIGNMLEGFSHNICDFAWNYLNIHQHLLKGSTDYYRTDKKGNWYD